MDLMITADDTLPDNQWWRKLFRLHAKKGDYFEIHYWSDETDALAAAAKYGSAACFSMPDIRIIHGTLTERLIRLFLKEEKPLAQGGYNKMIPYFTVRIGNHYSSEKYGTEVLLKTGEPLHQAAVERTLSDVTDHITVHRCD